MRVNSFFQRLGSWAFFSMRAEACADGVVEDDPGPRRPSIPPVFVVMGSLLGIMRGRVPRVPACRSEDVARDVGDDAFRFAVLGGASCPREARESCRGCFDRRFARVALRVVGRMAHAVFDGYARRRRTRLDGGARRGHRPRSSRLKRGGSRHRGRWRFVSRRGALR